MNKRVALLPLFDAETMWQQML